MLMSFKLWINYLYRSPKYHEYNLILDSLHTASTEKILVSMIIDWIMNEGCIQRWWVKFWEFVLCIRWKNLKGWNDGKIINWGPNCPKGEHKEKGWLVETQ